MLKTKYLKQINYEVNKNLVSIISKTKPPPSKLSLSLLKQEIKNQLEFIQSFYDLCIEQILKIEVVNEKIEQMIIEMAVLFNRGRYAGSDLENQKGSSFESWREMEVQEMIR